MRICAGQGTAGRHTVVDAQHKPGNRRRVRVAGGPLIALAPVGVNDLRWIEREKDASVLVSPDRRPMIHVARVATASLRLQMEDVSEEVPPIE
jgi:hypothetical protein